MGKLNHWKQPICFWQRLISPFSSFVILTIALLFLAALGQISQFCPTFTIFAKFHNSNQNFKKWPQIKHAMIYSRKKRAKWLNQVKLFQGAPMISLVALCVFYNWWASLPPSFSLGSFSHFHFQRELFPTFKRELFPLSMGELFLLSLSKGAFPHFQKGAFPTLNGGTFLAFTFTSTGGLGGLGDRQGTRVPLPIDNCLHKNCKCPGAALCIQILLRRWRQPESKNLFSMEITFLGCFHETSTLTIYDF